MVLGYPSPDYICEHWTEELFWLMIEKTNERITKGNEKHDGSVSPEVLEATSGGLVKKM